MLDNQYCVESLDYISTDQKLNLHKNETRIYDPDVKPVFHVLPESPYQVYLQGGVSNVTVAEFWFKILSDFHSTSLNELLNIEEIFLIGGSPGLTIYCEIRNTTMENPYSIEAQIELGTWIHFKCKHERLESNGKLSYEIYNNTTYESLSIDTPEEFSTIHSLETSTTKFLAKIADMGTEILIYQISILQSDDHLFLEDNISIYYSRSKKANFNIFAHESFFSNKLSNLVFNGQVSEMPDGWGFDTSQIDVPAVCLESCICKFC